MKRSYCMKMFPLLLPLLVTSAVGDFTLQILHMNDLHSRFEEISDGGGECKEGETCYGGFARLQTALKTSRLPGVHTIVLNAGDNYQGTPYYSVYKWRVVADLLNLINFDAMTIGNHEFDNGIAGLTPFIKNITAPVTVCNLNLSSEPGLQLDNLKKSVILDLNGNKVGVIGYITPDTKNLAIIKEDLILDEIPYIRQEAKHLKEANVSVIIGLGHSGITMDEKIAAEVEDIDVIVGGHSHTFLYTGKPPSSDTPVDSYPVVVTQASGKRVPIVHASAYSKYLGNITLDFDDEGKLKAFQGNPILLDSSIPQDERMTSRVNSWAKNLQHLKLEIVGKSWVTLDGNCNGNECNFGNLVTDAMVHMNSKQVRPSAKSWTDSSIAFVQGGGIRATLYFTHSRANVTLNELMTVFPFENTVEKTTITGQTLLDTLEWSVSALNPSALEKTKAFLQVSGLQVTYDIQQAPGNRVVSVLVRCANCTIPKYFPLEKDSAYVIMTSSFLLLGGDGYSVLRDNHNTTQPIGGNICGVLSEYMRDVGVVYPEVSGRIKFLEANKGSLSMQPSMLELLLCWILFIVV